MFDLFKQSAEQSKGWAVRYEHKACTNLRDGCSTKMLLLMKKHLEHFCLINLAMHHVAGWTYNK